MLKRAYENGLTSRDLCCMSARQVAWHIEGRHNEWKDEWRRTRRLCYYLVGSFRKFTGTEQSLWRIDEGEREQVSMSKIKKWNERLNELGK
jgi:hypothetical protein